MQDLTPFLHVRSGEITLLMSPAQLDELADVIGRAKFDAILVRSNTSREHTLEEVRRLADFVEAPPLAQPVCRDPDDDALLAAAVAGLADLIISGDEDVLCVEQFNTIPIVSPTEALRVVEANGQ